MGIFVVEDLLYHFPHRYLNTAKVLSISNVKVGEEVTVVGEVKIVRKTVGKSGIRVINVGIFDGTEYLYGVWFNQDFIADRLKDDMVVAFSGKTSFRYGQLQIENPLYEVIDEDTRLGEDTVHTSRIIPFHPASQYLTTARLRRIIKNMLDTSPVLSDSLPSFILAKYNFLDRYSAFKEIHFPTSERYCEEARRRLLYEELFLMQVGLAFRKKQFKNQTTGIAHQIEGPLIDEFYCSLPFALTNSQKKTISEILKDMASPLPMNRLLQGEVGSGKTVVALASLLAAVQSGYQAAMMAPTEILAEQHFKKITHLLEGLFVSHEGMPSVRIALLKGSLTEKEKKVLQEEISKGKVDIVIGTHAIIQKDVIFSKLGLVIVDEQHRFGVQQRVALKEKGTFSDVLVMTATPIPRTLSLTLYGDLDISIINELPGGRNLSEHVETTVLDKTHRNFANEKIRSEVRQGRQAYIICPLIEESDKLEVKAVMAEIERLENEVFPDLRVGFIHSKLKTEEKETTMESFVGRKLDVLISTTVVEVGVDVPNATVMLIEDAERFGLSQLHQLRGRIGRGQHKGYCFLFADPTTDEGRQRMEAIANTHDGFKLAELDLEIRGEGQIFGVRQSGLPDLKLAKITRDINILLQARDDAFELIEKDPALKLPENRPLFQAVRRKFASNLDWLFYA